MTQENEDRTRHRADRWLALCESIDVDPDTATHVDAIGKVDAPRRDVCEALGRLPHLIPWDQALRSVTAAIEDAKKWRETCRSLQRSYHTAPAEIIDRADSLTRAAIAGALEVNRPDRSTPSRVELRNYARVLMDRLRGAEAAGSVPREGSLDKPAAGVTDPAAARELADAHLADKAAGQPADIEPREVPGPALGPRRTEAATRAAERLGQQLAVVDPTAVTDREKATLRVLDGIPDHSARLAALALRATGIDLADAVALGLKFDIGQASKALDARIAAVGVEVCAAVSRSLGLVLEALKASTEDHRWLTTEQAAAYLDTSPGIIRAWIASGRLRASRFGSADRGPYRILASELQKAARGGSVDAGEPEADQEPRDLSGACPVCGHEWHTHATEDDPKNVYGCIEDVGTDEGGNADQCGCTETPESVAEHGGDFAEYDGENGNAGDGDAPTDGDDA